MDARSHGACCTAGVADDRRARRRMSHRQNENARLESRAFCFARHA
ncbi:hypothetical protein C7S16_0422 [Burkholderia thailandensis]|uniref:Uncharacterized protein n=1 Tax=Burkholderia thailandensis TaxID=57975 RepID=A0AAW9D2A4_BURTH|nr:hypothetical protein [Burkholderia thailandensis]MDW9255437.1 hypothetical protein [Burkholderia thailandensis]